MSDRVPPIARIRLSRSLPRLLVLPFLGFLAGAAAIAAGLLLVPDTIGLVVAGLGGTVILGSLIGAIGLLSVRLDVEEAAVCLGWLGGERIYPLSPGPVTRVRLRGDNASRLRSAPRLLPWQLGRGRLRGEEDVEVVRLAPTPTAILVPTERGRLAIAAADEKGLLDALSRAARARQRLEDLTRDAPPVVEPTRPVEVEVTPALMTGIERALFEDRMADERAAALGAAEGERLAAVAGTARSTRAPVPSSRRFRKGPWGIDGACRVPYWGRPPDRASRSWRCRWSGPVRPGASPSCSTGCPTQGQTSGASPHWASCSPGRRPRWARSWRASTGPDSLRWSWPAAWRRPSSWDVPCWADPLG